jgi:RNA polymerase primary sigma factor/RNA polymerase sigma factor
MTCQSPDKRSTRSYPGDREGVAALCVDPTPKRKDVTVRGNHFRQRRIAGDGDEQSNKRIVQSGRDWAATHASDDGVAKTIENRINGQYRRDENLDLLTQYQRDTKKNVSRSINATRLRKIMELPLEFIPNPQFLEADAEDTILADIPGLDLRIEPPKVPSGLPSYLASMYEVPLLTREQEIHLFRKFNYLKYKAATLRSRLVATRAKQRLLEEIERIYDKVVAVKKQILRANLRLVVSIAKRYVRPGNDLWELISDGNVSLIKAVDKFDFARGNKISTYASWAIMRNFARTIPTEQRHRDRFRTSQFETLGSSQEHRSDPQEQESSQRRRAAQVQKILSRLDEREQLIVISRFGLLPGHEPQTLEEIGAEMGVSKERVRQIQTRALSKLRNAALAEHIEMLGLD